MNALDTHRLVKRLVAVGFSDEQAETVTDVVREGREADFSNLATKAELTQEIGQLRQEMYLEFGKMRQEMHLEFGKVREEFGKVRQETGEIRHDIGQLRQEVGHIGSNLTAMATQLRTEAATAEARLYATISETKSDILKWVVGLLFIQVGLVIALMKLMGGH